jgi:hypothetical protein
MLLSAEQQMVQDMARSFAREQLAPHAAAWERQAAFPAEVLRSMGKLGFMGMTVPLRWGGAGTDFVSYALALEEIAAGDGSISTVMSVNNSVVCAGLLNHGSDLQKERFLKPLARGEIIGAFCLSEAQAGSDAAAIRTRAEYINGNYVLNGNKQFVTSGRSAALALVFAVTDKTAGKQGISAFIVPADSPGYQVTKVESKLGQKASDTCAISFDNVTVPENQRLGAAGQGYRIALSNLEQGRIGIAAQSVGMARAALKIAIDYARQRETFGRRIIEHQAVGHRLADMATRLEAAHQLVLHAASLRDAGQPALAEACMAKLFASETAEAVCSAAIQTLGGYGYLTDFPLERIYRDVRVCQIYEGTSDIQRMLVCRSLMVD